MSGLTLTLLMEAQYYTVLFLQNLLLYPPLYRHKVPQIGHYKKYIQYDCSVLALRTGYLI